MEMVKKIIGVLAALAVIVLIVWTAFRREVPAPEEVVEEPSETVVSQPRVESLADSVVVAEPVTDTLE